MLGERISSESRPDDWLVGPDGLRLSWSRRRAFAGSRELPLTKTTFDVLALLLRRHGEAVTIEELVREVWGYEDIGRSGFARTAVYRLRKELRAAGIDDPIEAIRGVGFRIADEQSEADAEEDARATFSSHEALMFAATAIFVVSPDQRVLWANHAAERLSGYSVDELRALPSTAELAGGTNPEVYERFRELIRSGQTLQGPAKTRQKDGTVLDLPASWKPVFDPDGELLYTIVEFWSESGEVVVQRAG